MSLRKKIRKHAIPWFLAIYALVSFAGWAAWGAGFLYGVLFAALGLIGASVTRLMIGVHDLTQAQKRDYRQLEALTTLTPLLDLASPLPPMRQWASSPDYLAILAREILSRKPQMVVELGSGVSSVVVGACLRRNGHGRLVSIEQDSVHAGATRERIALEHLDGIVKVIHAPLAAYGEGEALRWYDTAPIDDLCGVDMVIIDGPSVTGQKAYLRYPALPFFAERRGERIAFILDDAGRPDEQRSVERWRREYPDLRGAFLETEKGAWIGTLD